MRGEHYASNHIVQYLGERAVMKNEPRTASVTVASVLPKVLANDRDSIDRLLRPLKDLLEMRRRKAPSGRFWNSGSRAVPGSPRRRRDAGRTRGAVARWTVEATALWSSRNTRSPAAPRRRRLWARETLSTGMQEDVMNEKNILRLPNSLSKSTFRNLQRHADIIFPLGAALGGELEATY